MSSTKYKAFEVKLPARYGGVGNAYRAGNAVRPAAGEARGALAAWEGEGGRIAPSPTRPSRL